MSAALIAAKSDSGDLVQAKSKKGFTLLPKLVPRNSNNAENAPVTMSSDNELKALQDKLDQVNRIRSIEKQTLSNEVAKLKSNMASMEQSRNGQMAKLNSACSKVKENESLLRQKLSKAEKLNATIAMELQQGQSEHERVCTELKNLKVQHAMINDQLSEFQAATKAAALIHDELISKLTKNRDLLAEERSKLESTLLCTNEELHQLQRREAATKSW